MMTYQHRHLWGILEESTRDGMRMAVCARCEDVQAFPAGRLTTWSEQHPGVARRSTQPMSFDERDNPAKYQERQPIRAARETLTRR